MIGQKKQKEGRRQLEKKKETISEKNCSIMKRMNEGRMVRVV